MKRTYDAKVAQPASRLPAPAPIVAELRRVSKSYGDRHALRDVELALASGEILALLGPNGAGKTTAIKLLLGLRRPDVGQVLVFGSDPRRAATRRQIAATPQELDFPPTLRVSEIIDLVRGHYPKPLALADVSRTFGLGEIEKRQTGGLSGGQKRKLSVATAFAANPPVIFLDEPTTGLDVESRFSIWQAVRDFVRVGGTVLLTTHYLEEAEALASRVVVIHRGRIIADGSVADIKGRTGLKKVQLRAASLPPLAAVSELSQDAGRFTIYTHDADALVRELVTQKVPFSDIEIVAASLEEAFLRLLTEDGDASL